MAKVFNDPVHGHIELHPLLVRIIDTPQFQRLRNIKQLGGGYFVYPGASHNRFEHCIGVGHLAGELAKALRTKQLEDSAEESLITDRDILCVQIAGLCHDLGHGPFSHVFEELFKPTEDWEHEDASIVMIDDILLDDNLKSEMKRYGLEIEGDSEKDLTFIKEMIKGPLKKNLSQDKTLWPYDGRSKEKSFLYEIVANKQNGIDVDKFDYFARDCHHLGMQNSFDHRRFIVFARVCDVNGQKHICSREKEITNLYNMFHTRESLHRRAYQHRVKVAVEIMIKDALLKASKDKDFEYLWTVKTDMKAYTKLTDHVIEEILHHGASSNESTPSPLQEAAQILQRITTRNFYQLVGEIKLTEKDPKKIKEIKARLAKELAKAIPKDGKQDEKDYFEITVAKFDYGMKDEDPISKYTYFYDKFEPTVGFSTRPEKVPDLLPKCFSEKILKVYWKKCDQKSLEDAKNLFNPATVLGITTGEHNQAS